MTSRSAAQQNVLPLCWATGPIKKKKKTPNCLIFFSLSFFPPFFFLFGLGAAPVRTVRPRLSLHAFFIWGRGGDTCAPATRACTHWHTHTPPSASHGRACLAGGGGRRDVGGLSAVTWSSEKRRWWWWRGGGGLWICSARAKQLRRPESGARACECVSVCVSSSLLLPLDLISRYLSLSL